MLIDQKMDDDTVVVVPAGRPFGSPVEKTQEQKDEAYNQFADRFISIFILGKETKIAESQEKIFGAYYLPLCNFLFSLYDPYDLYGIVVTSNRIRENIQKLKETTTLFNDFPVNMNLHDTALTQTLYNIIFLLRIPSKERPAQINKLKHKKLYALFFTFFETQEKNIQLRIIGNIEESLLFAMNIGQGKAWENCLPNDEILSGAIIQRLSQFLTDYKENRLLKSILNCIDSRYRAMYILIYFAQKDYLKENNAIDLLKKMSNYAPSFFSWLKALVESDWAPNEIDNFITQLNEKSGKIDASMLLSHYEMITEGMTKNEIDNFINQLNEKSGKIDVSMLLSHYEMITEGMTNELKKECLPKLLLYENTSTIETCSLKYKLLKDAGYQSNDLTQHISQVLVISNEVNLYGLLCAESKIDMSKQIAISDFLLFNEAHQNTLQAAFEAQGLTSRISTFLTLKKAAKSIDLPYLPKNFTLSEVLDKLTTFENLKGLDINNLMKKMALMDALIDEGFPKDVILNQLETLIKLKASNDSVIKEMKVLLAVSRSVVFDGNKYERLLNNMDIICKTELFSSRKNQLSGEYHFISFDGLLLIDEMSVSYRQYRLGSMSALLFFSASVREIFFSEIASWNREQSEIINENTRPLLLCLYNLLLRDKQHGVDLNAMPILPKIIREASQYKQVGGVVAIARAIFEHFVNLFADEKIAFKNSDSLDVIKKTLVTSLIDRLKNNKTTLENIGFILNTAAYQTLLLLGDKEKLLLQTVFLNHDQQQLQEIIETHKVNENNDERSKTRSDKELDLNEIDIKSVSLKNGQLEITCSCRNKVIYLGLNEQNVVFNVNNALATERRLIESNLGKIFHHFKNNMGDNAKGLCSSILLAQMNILSAQMRRLAQKIVEEYEKRSKSLFASKSTESINIIINLNSILSEKPDASHAEKISIEINKVKSEGRLHNILVEYGVRQSSDHTEGARSSFVAQPH